MFTLRVTMLAAVSVATVAVMAAAPVEPSAEVAAGWFPPQRNVWTPVGLPSHPFRFNVIYNGTVVADPHPLRSIVHNRIKQYLDPYDGLGVQLSFTHSPDGALPTPTEKQYQLSDAPDNGVGLQRWSADNAAPVLETSWPLTTFYTNTGVVLKQSVFAHTPGGNPIRTGRESIYAWIRFEVDHVDPLSATTSSVLLAHVGAASHVKRSMFHEENLTVMPEARIYPRALTRETYSSGTLSGCRLVEPDGKIRLDAITASGSVMLDERTTGSRDYFLRITLPSKVGNYVDLLLPMLPADPGDIANVAARGYEGARAESDKFWRAMRPATAAVIDTPEPQVNEAFRRLTEIAMMVTETNPDTGDKAFLTGSWNYDTLWPTPASMAAHMHLSLLGYHQFVGEHLDIYLAHQGKAKPPGDAYTTHPGYFSAPRQLSSVDWLTDHGSILHTAAQHALLSGDKQFLDRWLQPIINGAAFLRDSRMNTSHTAVKGVLPPAVATDAEVPLQAVWNIAWNYKGLVSAVRLLKSLKHPDAAIYEAEAQEYKRVFVDEFRKHTAAQPRWTDAAGKQRPIVPSTLFGPEHRDHPFFLDTGAMVLPYSGLFDATDPLIQNSLAWYRQGPNTKLYDPRGNMHQRAILTHEISSCEPCYSFNILCSWQSGDRQRFLEGMYALLTGSLGNGTFSGCEHRHGIYALPAPGALMIYNMRLAVIDDQITPGEVHLLRLTPRAWLTSDYEARFENMATEYGPVTLKFKLNEAQDDLQVTWVPSFRTAPEAVKVHVPPIDSLKSVTVNGKKYPITAGDLISVVD